MSYSKLPLGFEANQGQASGPVRFLSRGSGYTIFFTDDEAVLTLRKSQPGVSRLGKFGLSDRLDSFDAGDLRAGHWPSLTDRVKSVWPRLIPDLGQMIPEPNAGRRGEAAGRESQPSQVVRMRLVGGNAKPRVVGLDELSGKSNYFIGNDPGKWRTNISNYSKVNYQNVYPGVDLVYYGNQRQLEYDFVVAPGADPSQIKLSFAGADGMRIDGASGDLVLKLGDDEVRFQKPVVYQAAVAAASGLEAGHASLVSSFVLGGNDQVAFRVAGYDSRRALVIDPVLTYSTYLGGTNFDYGYGIALDSSGNAHVTGYTGSTNFPTVNPIQAQCGVQCSHGYDAFVSKLNATGSALIYSTYLGGYLNDQGNGIALDSSDNAYVIGTTLSSDFPTLNPLQKNCAGSTPKYEIITSAFVAKLGPTGSLVYSTCLGSGGQYVANYSLGTAGNGIAVDSNGNAYVTGWTNSSTFPTVNPLQPQIGGSSASAFVSKLNAAGSSLVYSSYLGGSGETEGNGIAVDSSGNAYVTGRTGGGFPTVNPIQSTFGGCKGELCLGGGDAFVAKLNAPGSALVYSTYLGGNNDDRGYGIAVDSSGNAYVIGATDSTNFPARNPLQGYVGGTCGSAPDTYACQDAFVAKLNAAGSALVYSTYLGGSAGNQGSGIAVDSSGNAYVTGTTHSSDFPTSGPTTIAAPLQAAYGGGGDAFVAELNLNAAGLGLVYSIYLGGSGEDSGNGIAVDSSGNAYVTGYTTSTDFPTVIPIQPCSGMCKTGGDAFVAKISTAGEQQSQTITFGVLPNVTLGVLPFTLSATASSGLPVTFTSTTPGVCTVSAGTVATVSAGTCSITASQAGSAIYAAATPVTQSFTVSPAAGIPQTITFGPLSTVPFGTSPFAINATASSGLTVSFASTTTSVCTVSGKTVTIVAIGTCSITASQAGNSVYSAAAPVTQTFIVSAPLKALQLITVTPCRIIDTRNPNGPLGGPFVAGGTTRTIPIPSSTCGIPASASAYSLNFTVVPRAGALAYLTVWPAGQAQPLVSTLNSLDGSTIANAAIVPAGAAGAIDAFATNDTDLIVDVNGYFVPPTTGSLQFYPLTPCRILDTRNANGTFGGPSLAGGTPRSFPIQSSSCGIPAKAAAYAFNVTVVPHGALGYLTAWPSGQTQPVVSTLNSYDGTTLANAAIVPAGSASQLTFAPGAVSFFASNTTDLVVDINGYFAPTGTGGLNFYALPPCRLVDTRNATGTFGGPTMGGGTTRAFPLSQGFCGLPGVPGAQAYSVNMTVVPQGVLSYLSTWPTGAAQPVVSTLNAFKGQVVANAAIVPAGGTGSIDVYVTNTTDVVIDINGYFRP